MISSRLQIFEPQGKPNILLTPHTSLTAPKANQLSPRTVPCTVFAHNLRAKNPLYHIFCSVLPQVHVKPSQPKNQIFLSSEKGPNLSAKANHQSQDGKVSQDPTGHIRDTVHHRTWATALQNCNSIYCRNSITGFGSNI